MKKLGFLVLFISLFWYVCCDVRAMSLKDVPIYYQDQINNYELDTDLQNVTFLKLNIKENEDLAWLGETNVEVLELSLTKVSDNLQVLNKLKTVKVLKISGVERIYFRNEDELEKYKKQNSSKIKSYSLTDLYVDVISDLVIDNELLSYFNKMNIISLELNTFKISDKFELSELENYNCLESLTLNPYIFEYDGLDKIIAGVQNLELKEFNVLVNKSSLTDRDIVFLNKIASLDKIEKFLYERYDKVGFKYCKDGDVASLRIGQNEKFSITDYQNINVLNTIDFSDMAVYDAAIYFTQDDINNYEAKQISITSDSSRFLEDLKSIDRSLDSILEGIGILDNLDRQSKVDKVLLYIIDNYKYDYLSYFKDIDITYYNDGYLYGIFNDDMVICGNYAALFSALLTRLNIDVYFVNDDSHAWNLIFLDNKYYAIDITALYSSFFSLEYDNSINSVSAKEKYYGYMDDTSRYFNRSRIVNYPEWLNINTSDKYFRVEMLYWFIIGTMGFSVMLLCGLVYFKYKRKPSLASNEVIGRNMHVIYRF